MSSLLNATVSSQLLSENPVLSLSVKITESIMSQVNQNLQAHAISTEHWVALKLMHDGAASFPSELSELMGISAPRITKVIDHLESKNLIARNASKEDRRKFTISLSTKGKNLVKKVVKVGSLSPIMDESLLTDKERPLYNCYLKKAS